MGPCKKYNKILRKRLIRFYAKQYQELKHMQPNKTILQKQINILDNFIYEIEGFKPWNGSISTWIEV